MGHRGTFSCPQSAAHGCAELFLFRRPAKNPHLAERTREVLAPAVGSSFHASAITGASQVLARYVTGSKTEDSVRWAGGGRSEKAHPPSSGASAKVAPIMAGSLRHGTVGRKCCNRPSEDERRSARARTRHTEAAQRLMPSASLRLSLLSVVALRSIHLVVNLCWRSWNSIQPRATPVRYRMISGTS